MAIFDENVEPRPENFLEELVGDGKKFKTVDDLAKGKWESDNFIKTQNERIQVLEAELATRENVEKLLNERLSRNPDSPVEKPETHKSADTETKPLSKEELAAMIREITEQENRTQTVQGNLTEVQSKLEDLYGDRAAEIVAKRARELGVSVKFLESIAEQSPKAFFAQLGVEPNSRQAPAGPTPREVNKPATTSSQPRERTYAWYQNLRRTSPSSYESLYMQMMNDAAEQGDDFYN